MIKLLAVLTFLYKLLPLVSMSLIFVGTWMISPSISLITLGAMIWLDLQIKGKSE